MINNNFKQRHLAFKYFFSIIKSLLQKTKMKNKAKKKKWQTKEQRELLMFPVCKLIKAFKVIPARAVSDFLLFLLTVWLFSITLQRASCLLRIIYTWCSDQLWHIRCLSPSVYIHSWHKWLFALLYCRDQHICHLNLVCKKILHFSQACVGS